MARNILNKLLDKRITQLKAKAKTKTLTAATPTVDDPTLQTWIKEVSSTVKDIASSGVRRSDLVRAGIATITNGELQNALSPPEEVNLTVPAAVLNLTANGAYSSNTLTWETRPSKFFGQNNIYRSDVDDFGTATHIGSSLGDVYTDYVGNNIKAYYWVRTISKFGVEGELSPSVYAATAIDVGYVLQQLEGHITLSQLDQILRGEISSISDIANGLQEEARLRVLELAALADQLRQESIDKAQEIQDRIDGVNNQIQQQIIALNDGITTEVNSRLDGDQQNINLLEAYKLSNDNAVGAVIDKVDIAISTNEVHAAAISGLQTNFETVSGQLATKADVSNLTLAENKIAEVEGRVIATTENITALGTRMGTVEGAVSTKLDASAINNYYTKTQADDKSAEIAAGKIESYNANLVIGGTNLFSIADSIAGYTAYGTGSIIESTPSHLAMQSIIPIGTHKQLVYQVWNPSLIINTVNTNRLVFFKADGSFLSLYDVPQLDGTPYQKSLITVPDTAAYVRLAAIVGQYNEVRDPNLKVKFEFGNKPTDWTPSDGDVQSSLNANANAIQTVTAEVLRINGEVVSTANSVNTLSSNVGLLQGSINEVRQTVTNNQESTNILVTSLKSGMADADDVSIMMRNAAVVFEDLSFKNGWNGIGAYNNYMNGALAANFTDKLPDNPVASTRQIQFIHSGGATTPWLGGYHQAVQSRANGVFLVKFVAKLPIGFSFGLAANAYGDGANGYFIGGSEGTGKFKTYYAVYRCGATGYFSTVGFVYVWGSHPTPENPLIWYLASSTVYDCLDSKVVPDSVVNGIAEAKSTANTAVNKSEATALIAQNLQASLDNTNANISNNYYTKSSTDEAISNQITNLSATLGMNVLPSKRDTTKANQWLLTHVVPKDAGWVSEGVKPDFSTLKTGIKNKRIYCADGNTMFSSSEYDNTALYFRTIVYVHTDVEVNLGNFIGDDAHSIYVNGVLNFTKGYYGSTDNLRLALKTGLNTVDVICYNGFGGAGFSSSVSLSSLVVNMYAPESVEEQAAATANAVSSLTTTVSDLNGVVSSQARQLTTLESSKSAIENGAIAGNDEYIVDLRDPAYNRDLYYPVLLSGFSTEYRQTIRVMSTLNGASVPPWSSHGGGFSLNAQFQMGGAGWGTINPEIVTDNFSFSFTHGSISPLDEIGQMWTSSQPFFYVRGGGYYRLSKPVSKSVQVCAPGGSLVGYHGETVYPRPYQASTVPKSINQGLNQQNVKLQQTNAVIDGVKAISTVTVDNNGVMSGYGLISELANGQVTSSFGVNADTFFIGSPNNNKKPFIHRNDWSVINGVWVPPGTYIDTALIANATISNAQVGDLSADKITAGNIAADRMKANIVAAVSGQFTELSAITAKIGVLRTATSGARTEIKDNLIEVYDDAGRVRVKIGVF